MPLASYVTHRSPEMDKATVMFQLCELGIDLCYQLDGQLNSPTTRSLVEARDKLVDVVKLRCAEDNWKRLNLNSKSAVHKLNTELSEYGLTITKYVTGNQQLCPYMMMSRL